MQAPRVWCDRRRGAAPARMGWGEGQEQTLGGSNSVHEVKAWRNKKRLRWCAGGWCVRRCGDGDHGRNHVLGGATGVSLARTSAGTGARGPGCHSPGPGTAHSRPRKRRCARHRFCGTSTCPLATFSTVQRVLAQVDGVMELYQSPIQLR